MIAPAPKRLCTLEAGFGLVQTKSYLHRHDVWTVCPEVVPVHAFALLCITMHNLIMRRTSPDEQVALYANRPLV